MKEKIINLAAQQIGNGYSKYCSAFGYNYRIEWCACFISWLSKELNLGFTVYQSMSCTQMANWYKKNGMWHEAGELPQAGDIMFYDWNPAGHDGVDHVGIVECVDNGNITVIEGNKNDVVARRVISANYSMIYGFARPKYTSDTVKADKPKINAVEPVKPTVKPINNVVKQDYINYTVVKGDTLWDIAKRYLKNGSRYPEIKKLNGLKSDIIHSGQVLKIPKL